MQGRLRPATVRADARPPALLKTRHSRASGNPLAEQWVPAFAGTTTRISVRSGGPQVRGNSPAKGSIQLRPVTYRRANMASRKCQRSPPLPVRVITLNGSPCNGTNVHPNWRTSNSTLIRPLNPWLPTSDQPVVTSWSRAEGADMSLTGKLNRLPNAGVLR